MPHKCQTFITNKSVEGNRYVGSEIRASVPSLNRHPTLRKAAEKKRKNCCGIYIITCRQYSTNIGVLSNCKRLLFTIEKGTPLACRCRAKLLWLLIAADVNCHTHTCRRAIVYLQSVSQSIHRISWKIHNHKHQRKKGNQRGFINRGII